MPSTKVRPKANQHDKRHESGLAAPGKRIHRQKSNPKLNGHTNGRLQTPTPPLPSSDLEQHLTLGNGNLDDVPNGFHHDSSSSSTANGSPPDNIQLDPRARAYSELSFDGQDSYRYTNGNINHILDPVSRPIPSRMDINGVKGSGIANAGNVFTLASTIIASCPLRDVIAILIILLQLPPTFLTIIHCLFATLTFVPPSTGTSLSALPSLNDMFQGAGGTPSMATIIFADIIILIFWLVLSVPVQNITLDLAQAVIAISLGGAAAGTGGSTNSLFLCVVIIIISHTLRYNPVRHYGLQLLWVGFHKIGFPVSKHPPTMSDYPDTFNVPHGWLRSLLGVHILTQGVVRLIRRSLANRESLSGYSPDKKNDPEAAAAGQMLRANLSALDSNTTDAGSSSSTDGRPPGPSPAAREAKERSTGGKKKRKQSNQVRSQQPFWAALASTKVTVYKEMEHSQASSDAAEANATDAYHVGNANFIQEEDRVWISAIGSTDISFGLNLLREMSMAVHDGMRHGANLGSGIDKSKPFYVRVNGADWSSTRINEIHPNGSYSGDNVDAYSGEIFGLTPLSSYYIEFVRMSDDTPIYSASLITQSAPATEPASVVAPTTHQSLRPSSPTTTLKNSILAAEQKLSENRNRQKRNRKDHKGATGALRKEVDNLNNRVSSSGGTDDRQKSKVLQFKQTIRQTEESTVDICHQIDTLGEIPRNEIEEASAKKEAWKQERAHRSAVSEDYSQCKGTADTEVAHIQAEIASAIQKRDRLQARQTKLNEQYATLMAATTQDMDEKARREKLRAVRLASRSDQEKQYVRSIAQFESQLHDVNLANDRMFQQISHVENLLSQQATGYPNSVPTTPEGNLPGASNRNSLPQFPPLNYQTFGLPPSTDVFQGTPAPKFREGRGRSSSMLSGVSGFTAPDLDDPERDALLGTHNAPVGYERKGSNGSGSGSANGSNPGSQRDPLSPIGGR